MNEGERGSPSTGARAGRRGRACRRRLHLGLEIPAGVRGALGAWLGGWMPGAGMEPVDPSELRVALVLLGTEEAELRAAVEGALEEGRPGPIQVRLEDRPLRLAAPGGAITVLGARCRGGARLRRRMAAGPGIREAALPAARFLRPHVLLGSAATADGHGPAPGAPPGLPEGLRGTFEVVRADLYLSRLEPSGPKQVPVVQFELPRGAAVR